MLGLFVNRTSEDVLRVAAALGAARTTDAEAIAFLLTPKFESALEMVCAKARFESLHRERDAVTSRLLEQIGEDLSGFVIDDISLRVFARSSSEEAA